ncbi:MAG: c-type cytochrome domain-containing protein [Pricia sp.]
MTNTIINRWADYAVLGLSVFLIFCLTFESYIELPNLIAWLGRWHPLVLHFPIVLLLVAVFLGLTAKPIPDVLLTAAVLSALLTAILGFFLGIAVPIKGDLLFWHQWLGGATALIAALWYALYRNGLGTGIYTKILQITLVGLIGFTGHYGGMVTHGEEFLAFPTEEPKDQIPENPLVYQDVVYRILDDKCVACHNTNKQKGELLMTSYDQLLKGGEHGPILVAGNPEESEMIKRVHLPMDDKEHMPPEGKTPLEESEIAILEEWIRLGASNTQRLDELPKSERLVSLITAMMKPDASEKWANLPTVADSTLQRLASDYLSISRVAGNSQALSVVFFPPPEYDSKTITDLKRIAQNIVELDVSGMPLGQKEFEAIGTFRNLERLEVDKTPIDDSGVQELASLKQLHLLKIYDTAITDQSVPTFLNLPNLKQLYLFKTQVSVNAVASLKKDRPNLMINEGIDPEVEAFFIATDSQNLKRNPL